MDHLLSRRRIGALAPAMLIVAVPMAALAVANATWSAWVAGLASAAAVGVGTWWALAGLRRVVRVPVALAGVLASAGFAYLGLFVLWPALRDSEGLVSNYAMWAFVLVPWVGLIAGSTVATIIGKGPGAKPAWPWWLAGVAACVLAYPLVAWATTAFQADDMAALVILFIPAYALALWLGQLVVVLVTGLANPGPGAAVVPDAPADPAPPAAEVTAP
jgi:hypothetical protein